jgi:nitrogen fixation NifU-like protein
MYQEVILDHAKHPRGRGLAPAPEGDASGQSHQVNPTCGDEVTLRAAVSPNGVLDAVTWEGLGCSISQASTSVMAELVTGLPIAEVRRLDGLFHDLMNSRGKGLANDDDEDLLGDATAFTGTSQYPARIKCALLGWVALKDAIVRSGSPLEVSDD